MGNKHPQAYPAGDRSVSWEPDYRFRTGIPHGHQLPPVITPSGLPPPGPLPLYRPPGVPVTSRPSQDNGSVIRDGSIDGIQRLDDDVTKKKNHDKSQPGTNDSGYLTTSADSSARKKFHGSTPALHEPFYGHPPPHHLMMHGQLPGPYGPHRMPFPGSHVMMAPYGPGPIPGPYVPGYHGLAAPVSPDGRKKRGWKKKGKLSKSQINLYQPETNLQGHLVPANSAMVRAQSVDDILAQGNGVQFYPYAHGAEFATMQRPVGPWPAEFSAARANQRRPTPDGQEKPQETPNKSSTPETGSDTSKVVKAELHHSAETSAKAKARDAIYETLKHGKLAPASSGQVKITPEAKEIMDRNASILKVRATADADYPSSFSDVQTPVSRSELKTDEPLVSSPVILGPRKLPEPPLLSETVGSSSDSSEKENVIVPSLQPCPPKRQKHKSKRLFPALEAWDLLNVSNEVSRRHIGPKTPGELVAEDLIVPKVVPAPPVRRQTTEPIYLEYDDRLLPDFKKRLIETGSFDFVPEKRSLGSDSSAAKNKSSKNGSEPVLEQSRIPSYAERWPNEEVVPQQSPRVAKLKSEEKRSGFEQIKNSVANVFRRTKSSEKVLDDDSAEPSISADKSFDQQTGDNSVIDFSWVDDLEHKFCSSNVDQELIRQQREEMMKNQSIDVFGTIMREKEREDMTTSISIGGSGAERAQRDGHPSPREITTRNVYRQFEKDIGFDSGFSKAYVKRNMSDMGQGSPGRVRVNQNMPPPNRVINNNQNDFMQSSPIRDMTSREAMMENSYFGQEPPLRRAQEMPVRTARDAFPVESNRRVDVAPDRRVQDAPVRRFERPLARPPPPEEMVLEHNPLHSPKREVFHEFTSGRDFQGNQSREPRYLSGETRVETPLTPNRQRRHMNFDAPIYKHTRGRSESDLVNGNGPVVDEGPLPRDLGRTRQTRAHHASGPEPVVSRSSQKNHDIFIPPPDYDVDDIPKFEAVYGSPKGPRRPGDLPVRRQNYNNNPWDYPTPSGSSNASPRAALGRKMPRGGGGISPAGRSPQHDRHYDSTEYYRNNILAERNRQQAKAMKKHGFNNEYNARGYT